MSINIFLTNNNNYFITLNIYILVMLFHNFITEYKFTYLPLITSANSHFIHHKNISEISNINILR